jgi:lipopolysaccharide transport system ATP-binding protein
VESLPAISLQGVSKCYPGTRRRHDRIGEDIIAGFKRLIGRGPAPVPPIWALREFSLDIQPGTVLGLIGHNGAGKSTLLKLLAGITQPTTGRITLRGQRTSILEIGTGFHPDLSGRQNVELAAAIAGLPARELRKRFDAIVDFSGIGGAIDQPVKQYSSGMYLRLAFSVAFFTDSDILLLDEVISVGDLDFRMRSAEKVREIAASGATVVLSSHELTAVSTLCTQVLILEKGELKALGPPKDIVERYMSTYFDKRQLGTGLDGRVWPTHPEVTLLGVRAHAAGKSAGEPITKEDEIVIVIDYHKQSAGVELGIMLVVSLFDQYLLSDSSQFVEGYQMSAQAPGDYQMEARIPANLLNTGTYYLHINFGIDYRLILPLHYVHKFIVVSPAWERAASWNQGTQLTPLRPKLHYTHRPLNP